MRIVHIMFCLLVLATPILAEETAPPREKLAAIESLVGTWVGSFEGVDGVKLEGRCSVSWAPTKYAIVWTWTAWPKGTPDKANGHGSGLIYWDPASKKIKELGVMSDGLTFTTSFSTEGDRLIGERTGVDFAGKATKSTEVWKFTAKEWISEPVEVRDESGKVVLSIPGATFLREK